MGTPSALPDVNFAVKPADQIEAEAVTDFEARFLELTRIPKTLGPADPVRMLIQNSCHLVTQLRTLIDFTGKQNLIKYSRDEYLDSVAGLYGDLVRRLPPSYARTVLRFALSAPVNFDVIIARGTRCAGASQLIFETDEEVRIPVAGLSVDVNGTCTTPGIVGNGFTPGQINQVVNWTQAFGLSVANLETTEGGADQEDNESLRFRTWLAPESQNTCGAREGYIFWARSASPAIIDVAVWSAPAIAGEVWIFPLMYGGRLPTQAEKDLVYATVSADLRRPVSDFVTVKDPEVVHYNLAIRYWIWRQNEISAPAIREAVAAGQQGWIDWTKSVIGRDIMPVSHLTRFVMVPGVKRVEIIEPLYTALIEYQLALPEVVAPPEFVGFEGE